MRVGSLSVLFPLALLAACGSGDKGAAPAADGPVAAKPAPAGKPWVEVIAATPENGYRMGNPDAPLKLIEYGSRACPYCAKFDAEGFPALKSGLIAAGKLSYEFRDYPIHGALDLAPILLGHCVSTEAFFPMLDQMMASQQSLLANVETVGKEAQAVQSDPQKVAALFAERLGYIDFVKARGVPEDKARACLADKARLDRVAADYEKANQQYNVRGTPTFILNGKVVEEVFDWAKLEPVLKAAGG